jgi:energy-coupling factor transporter ATP-binding protein EcfA2
MLNGLAEQRLLPLDPPADEPAASVYSFLQAETPQALNEAFFTQVVLPFLSGFGTFRTELPNFEVHLQHHLLDRTLTHLGENLKARAPAWRAYNRLMLEGMRDEIRSIDASQKEILDRLDALLAQPETAALAQWADSLADLLSATGRIEKQLTEGFEAVLDRLGEQRQEALTRFNLLLAASGRMEEKIDRVLRILEDGQFVVEGTPSVKLDAPPEPGEPPFKGLQYFTESDAHLFFGREKLTAKLVGRLRGSPSPDLQERAEAGGFLAVVGASGSGKSSVVRAGLIPALRRGEPLADGDLPPQGSTRWPVHIITPTAHPLEALAASLTRDTESVTATSTLVEDMEKDPKSLHLYALKLLSQNGVKPRVKRTKGKGGTGAKGNGSHGNGERGERLLLVVDQFEELFTLCHDETERQAFINNLLTSVGLCLLSPAEEAIAEPPAPEAGVGELPDQAAPDVLPDENRPTLSSPPSAVVLVLTLRADFYAQCAKYDNLRQAIAAHQEYIGPMTSEELRRAIEEPARRNGWEFERGVVGMFLRDLGADGGHLPEPGALPLLSHALLETWKRRRGKTMILESYAESGGVRGAIAKTAETVFYRRLNANQQNIARNVFLRLTELGEGTQDTRRRAALSELIPGPENAAAVELVLKTLADARLITIDEGAAEVAHEALIREWPTLRQWLDEDREGLRLHHQLAEAARDWKRLGNDTGAVYRGVRLNQILEWAKEHDDQLSPLEREFIEFSKFVVDRDAALREEQRKRELEAAQRLAE